MRVDTHIADRFLMHATLENCSGECVDGILSGDSAEDACKRFPSVKRKLSEKWHKICQSGEAFRDVTRLVSGITGMGVPELNLTILV